MCKISVNKQTKAKLKLHKKLALTRNQERLKETYFFQITKVENDEVQKYNKKKREVINQ